ncbi:hypothetical protein B7755_031675 [Streptomyces sp. NBS 14/10]|uniref:hypothetical protein n=1 Tax=Streptomyces sp. NBS 14/10 TaxID=1945643 RepID=UPI00117E5A4E|nr:hypothetical protein [Streptomyces sp. NBS 14/10]KAK1182290.1 hypothetical protein B7755_031675 [Streptomyces sp. NBS 14/10]NUS87315.1 hypothetical protein [Streptomyces sp.]
MNEPVDPIGAVVRFYIQSGCPEVLKVETADDMADAVGQLYPLETEHAVLVWNRIPVLLEYRYDIPVLLDDLVPLLEEIQRAEFSETRVYWGSDTFSTEWQIRRDGELLRIDSRWMAVSGSYESLLNGRSQLTVEIRSFVAEWLKVLRRIAYDLGAQSVRLEDHDIAVRVNALLTPSH